MNNAISVILTLVYIAIVATLVIKKVNSVFVFLMTGMGVLLIASLVTGTSVLGVDSTSGNLLIDVFVFSKDTFSSNLSGIGLTLMMITGYAMYMSHIGASTKLAYLAMKPLSKISNPYIVLGMLFVIGICLKLVITSAAGLGMLLMSIAFPILISMGVSKTSASVVAVMCSFLDWGPNDSSAIFSAEQVCGMPMMQYFLSYQGKVGLILTLIAAVMLPIYLKAMDKKSVDKDVSVGGEKTTVDNPDCPGIYAVLPIVPLALVTIFSFVPTISLDVTTANLLSLVAAFLIELIRRRSKEVPADMAFVMKAMSNSYANVVSILIGAAVFAKAINVLGGITIISNALATFKSAPILTVAMMSLITFLSGIVLGSGNASWYAFGPLVPDVASQMGLSAATIAVPMQLATSIGRSMSPVAGVVIAVSGMAGVDSQEVVKRCSVPVTFLFICNIIISYIIVTL